MKKKVSSTYANNIFFFRHFWTYLFILHVKTFPTDEGIDYQLIDFYEETKVKFADLSEDMLWEYINSGEPM